jgi:hypothetical protein
MKIGVSTTGVDKLCLSDGVPSSSTFMQLAAFLWCEDKTSFNYFIVYFLIYSYALNLYCILKTIKILADKQVFEFLVHW